MVLPQALVFLIGYGKDFQPMITLTEYSSLFLTIIVGLGVVFEMPILVFFLALMGIVSAGWMWHNIRYSILGIFVVAQQNMANLRLDYLPLNDAKIVVRVIADNAQADGLQALSERLYPPQEGSARLRRAADLHPRDRLAGDRRR